LLRFTRLIWTARELVHRYHCSVETPSNRPQTLPLPLLLFPFLIALSLNSVCEGTSDVVTARVHHTDSSTPPVNLFCLSLLTRVNSRRVLLDFSSIQARPRLQHRSSTSKSYKETVVRLYTLLVRSHRLTSLLSAELALLSLRLGIAFSPQDRPCVLAGAALS
jgi:hypothetical protein